MEERRAAEERGGEAGTPERPPAGAANVPPFEEPAPGRAAEAGRPPSHREQEEEAARATSEAGSPAEPMHAIAPAAEGAGGRVREAARQADRRAGEALERAAERLEERKDEAARGLESSARRLREAADRYGESPQGMRATASRLAHGAATASESAADYLREADLEGLRETLERQVRERPLQTLLMAAAAGWLVGKLIR